MLHLLSLVSAAAGASCPTYTCSSSSKTSLECIQYSTSSGVDSYKITPCEFGQLCPFKSKQSSSCELYPINTRFPGEYCSENHDCLSGTCKGNVCQGIPSESKSNCTSTADCEPGLYCSDTKCVESVNEGDACTSDEECPNDSLCDLGFCVQLFSLDLEGQTNTTWGTLAPLCSTGYAVKVGDAWNCSAAPQSVTPDLVATCPETGVCTAKDGKTTRACECGYDGKQYCPLFEGDSQVTSMITAWKMLFENSNHNCNRMNPWSFECFYAINKIAYENYLAWSLNASLYLDGVWYKDESSKPCIDETLLLSFTDLETEYDLVSNNLAQCPAFKSVTQPQSWTANQCSYYSQNIYSNHFMTIYEIAACPKGQYCNTSPAANGTCTGNPTPTGAYPGQYCTLASECLSNNCTLHRCQGVAVGGACDSETKLCSPGSYCSSTTNLCEDVNQYPTCDADLNCNSSSLCLFGLCTLKFSVPNGQRTILTLGNTFGYSEACASGFGAYDVAKGFDLCAPAPVSKGTLLESCYYGETTTDSSNTYLETCVCGYGGVGSFPLYVGDGGHFEKLVSNFKKLAAKTSCYLNQWNSACVKHSDLLLGLFYEYNLNHLNLTNAAYYYKADDVVLQTYAAQFYEALVYQRSEESSSSSSSSSFGQVLTFVGLSYFILA